MEFDETLAAQMQRLREQQKKQLAELSAARDGIRQQLTDVNNQLAYLNQIQSELVKFRDKLITDLGEGTRGLKNRGTRQAPGTLIKAYRKALEANPQGLTAREVADWVKENMENVNVGAMPAVMSKAVTDGNLNKDGYGRHFLV
ncbi:hypothetical protein [Yoonia vestfoldensis]|uniref:Uncharacterized protein n=1 Tax=Yoonia vestfoldensis TaxID=245188 RepID=A0A1Y0EBE6_9RHOB|nr:hypothetical protein [Yoonia vestfoldensis]ARU00883.1 hypothetical protein LOKVESSMR4R_01567 [Yoonia vestfoldensis]